jgi:hypothetical protein
MCSLLVLFLIGVGGVAVGAALISVPGFQLESGGIVIVCIVVGGLLFTGVILDPAEGAQTAQACVDSGVWPGSIGLAIGAGWALLSKKE